MTPALRKNIETAFQAIFIPIGIILILYYGGDIIKWLLLAAIIAMLLNPVLDLLIKWGIPRLLAISITVLLFMLLIAIIVGLFYWQLSGLADQSDQIEKNVNQLYDQAQQYLSSTFHVSEDQISNQLRNQASQIQEFMKNMFGSMISGLSNFLLLIVYIFVLLLERERFENFAYKVFPADDQDTAKSIVDHSQNVASNYMAGKLVVMLLLGAMYALGFWAGGVDNFLLIALIAALLSIIPYVGNIVAGILAIALSIISGGGSTEILIVLGVISAAQVLESYILEPMIVGDRLRLNPFWVILGIVCFGSLWGIVGAIIALPIVGVIKLIFDHFDALTPFGYVMGQRKMRDEPESEIGNGH